MTNKFLIGGAAAAVFIAMIGEAAAANRTVCYRLQLRDDRENCPTSGVTGARRPCNPGGYTDMVGHQIELWDKDWSSDDEFIGRWYIAGGGTRCITFAWEGQPYQKGEANPDVYIRYVNRVNRTGYSNYVQVEGRDATGGAIGATSWRNGNASDPDRYVAMNCAAGATCQILPSSSLVPTNDIASDRAQRTMSLDSAQHALQVFGEDMNTNIILKYPTGGSKTTARDTFEISSTRGDDAQSAAHEMGHVAQMQQFGQDNLRDACGDSHSFTSIEAESCVTTEGFANYAGAVAWYDPDTLNTDPQRWGTSFETAAPNKATCADNTEIELQAAKAFWDLDDATNEAGVAPAAGSNDLRNDSSTFIMDGWDVFADGTSNRQDYENDNDGVNVRDYRANNSSRFTGTGFDETILNHNCLQSMDNG